MTVVVLSCRPALLPAASPLPHAQCCRRAAPATTASHQLACSTGRRSFERGKVGKEGVLRVGRCLCQGGTLERSGRGCWRRRCSGARDVAPPGGSCGVARRRGLCEEVGGQRGGAAGRRSARGGGEGDGAGRRGGLVRGKGIKDGHGGGSGGGGAGGVACKGGDVIGRFYGHGRSVQAGRGHVQHRSS